jgi:hypothetical protein
MFEGKDTKIIRRLIKNGVIFYCERVILYRKNNQRDITFEVRQKTGVFTTKLLGSFLDEIDAVNYLDNLIGEIG